MPILIALASAGFLSTLVLRMADPIIPILSAEFGVAAADLAILTTAYAVPYALFQLLFGPLGDLFGKVRVIRLAVLALAAFIALTALVPGYHSMIVARMLSGSVGGAIIPLGIATIGDRTPMATRQVKLSQFMMAVLLGQITGAFLTGIAAEFLPWRAIFGIYSVVAFVIGGLLHRLPGDAPERSGRRTFAAAFAVYGPIFARRKAQVLFVLVCLEGMLVYGVVAYLPPYLADLRHLTPGQIGSVVGSFGIGGLVFSVTVAVSLKVLGPYRMIALGGLVGGLAAGLVTRALPLPLYMTVGLMLGLSFFLMHSNFQVRATELAPEARGSALAAFACALFLGNGIGPGIFGHFIPAFGYTAVFCCIGILLACFGIIAAQLLRSGERAA